jgi:hypothetical protein
MTIKANTVETVLASSRQQLAALGTEGQCKSDDDREQFWQAYQPLAAVVSTLMNAPADISRVETRLKPRQAALDKARKAETAATQSGDAASLTALHDGVRYVDGEPLLPASLREALTDVCPTCGHAELIWLGPIPTLIEQIETLQKKRDGYQRQLAIAMQEREPVLSS